MAEHTWRYYVDQAREAASWLKLAPIPDEDLPDAIGHTNHVRSLFQGIVVALKTETPDDAIGKEYQMVKSGGYQRSYNVPAIVQAVTNRTDTEIGGVLVQMVTEGVLEISSWTKLQKFLESKDVTIIEASHEITEGDPDGAMVGKYWKSRPANVQALEKEQT